MLLATSTVLHQVFSVGKTPQQTLKLGMIIYGCLTAFTIYHCVTDELIMHQVIFGMSSHFILYHDMFLLLSILPSFLISRNFILTSRSGNDSNRCRPHTETHQDTPPGLRNTHQVSSDLPRHLRLLLLRLRFLPMERRHARVRAANGRQEAHRHAAQLLVGVARLVASFHGRWRIRLHCACGIPYA